MGAVVIGVVVLIAGAILWAYHGERDARVELNAADLCPKDSSRRPPAIYLVLIDQTDPLEELARNSVANDVLQRLQTELEGESEAAANRLARVEVWTFTHGSASAPDNYRVGNVPLSLSRALSMCNPGAPAKWDHLYRNVDVIKRHHQRFYSSLKQIIDQSLAFKEAPRSPIIEALYGIGARVFSAPDLADTKKRLILVSDLVQGTQTADFFQAGYKPNFQAWRSTTAGRQTLPELTEVMVTAIMIPGSRPGLQNENLLGFWANLLQAAGAKPSFVRKP